MRTSNNSKNNEWPRLPYNNWKDTLETLHMWMQIVGKVKLTLAPFINQWWEVAFYVTSSGITTGRIPYSHEAFTIDFDFLNHQLHIHMSTNKNITVALTPKSVADFYKEFMALLKSIDIDVSINPFPTEVQNPIAFFEDNKHATYDREYVYRWWRILLESSLVFDRFRTQFRGKSSPIQFFWGSFDLNGTRFSGKSADPPKIKGEMGRIMKYAENEENFSFGFWPGDVRYPTPAYYVYMHPKPKGFEHIQFGPHASFNETLALCLYPYEVLRKTSSPEESLINFLTKSYNESAKLAGWNINNLQGPIPEFKA